MAYDSASLKPTRVQRCAVLSLKDFGPRTLVPVFEGLAQLRETEVGEDVVAVEVEDPQVLLAGEVGRDHLERNPVELPGALERDLVGDKLGDPLVSQLATRCSSVTLV